ncbi:MAG: DUF3604 domain-containing protein [Hyphomicrobiaceae bacterium]
MHTSISNDARAFGNTLGPREAYQFARGQEIIASTGQAVPISRPLDWMVVTDHAEACQSGLAGDRQARHIRHPPRPYAPIVAS